MYISTTAALAALALPLVSAQLSSIPQCAVGFPPWLQETMISSLRRDNFHSPLYLRMMSFSYQRD